MLQGTHSNTSTCAGQGPVQKHEIERRRPVVHDSIRIHMGLEAARIENVLQHNILRLRAWDTCASLSIHTAQFHPLSSDKRSMSGLTLIDRNIVVST
jgi:hypothetical protein